MFLGLRTVIHPVADLDAAKAWFTASRTPTPPCSACSTAAPNPTSESATWANPHFALPTPAVSSEGPGR